MKLLLAALLFASCVCVFAEPTDVRVVEMAPGVRVKMTEAELYQVLEASPGSVRDVTDYLEPVQRATPGSLDDIPSKPKYERYVTDELFPRIDNERLAKFDTDLSEFFTRYYKSDSGVQSSEWIWRSYLNVSTQFSRQVEVELWVHPSFSQWQHSVVVRIPGAKEGKGERVILGSHIDSVSWPNYLGRSPGADDDGSGTACVWEAFNVLLEAGYQPEATVEFHGYAAEEVGLLGSQDIARAYASEDIDVISMMQLDMTGYPKAGGDFQIGITRDGTNQELSDFIATLVETYTDATPYDVLCGYSCSDYASWDKVGYASAFPQESGNYKQIHTPNDVSSNLNLDYANQFTRLALGYIVELAGLDD